VSLATERISDHRWRECRQGFIFVRTHHAQLVPPLVTSEKRYRVRALVCLKASHKGMYEKPDFNADHTPIAYLISFRSYGTWLHGDARGSVDRFHNIYGTPKLPGYSPRVRYEQTLMKQPPVLLNQERRVAIRISIEETCKIRDWKLWAFNVRTNHVHSVVTALCKPEKVLAALKANATRSMKELGCWSSTRSPWAYRGSRVYLWTEKELYDAIDYVLYYQGESLP